MPNAATAPTPLLFANARAARRYNGKCKGCGKAHTALVVGDIRCGFVVDFVTDAAEILPLDQSGQPRRRCGCGAPKRVQLKPCRLPGWPSSLRSA